jgi:hypothetical protein
MIYTVTLNRLRSSLNLVSTPIAVRYGIDGTRICRPQYCTSRRWAILGYVLYSTWKIFTELTVTRCFGIDPVGIQLHISPGNSFTQSNSYFKSPRNYRCTRLDLHAQQPWFMVSPLPCKPIMIFLSLKCWADVSQVAFLMWVNSRMCWLIDSSSHYLNLQCVRFRDNWS